MPETPDLQTVALSAEPRLDDENIDTYIKRMLRLKERKYDLQQRIDLARIQLGILLDETEGEQLIPTTEPDDEALMVMEMLAAAHDFINTIDTINDEYIRLVRRKQQLSSHYKQYLHARGIVRLGKIDKPDRLNDINNGEIDPKIKEILRKMRREFDKRRSAPYNNPRKRS
jgi:hypothetical protein